jgi:hypothetical protein
MRDFFPIAVFFASVGILLGFTLFSPPPVQILVLRETPVIVSPSKKSVDVDASDKAPVEDGRNSDQGRKRNTVETQTLPPVPTVVGRYETEGSSPRVFIVRCALSLVIGLAALFIILHKGYAPKDKHWGYATVGTLLGYWLRG